MKKYKCAICGYVYDEAAGIPEKGVSPGTKWEELPDNFACPVCSASKTAFEALEEPSPVAPVKAGAEEHTESLRGLSMGEISAICSSLAKGCEKQRLLEEMVAFQKIADYFKGKIAAETGKTLEDAAKILDDDKEKYSAAREAATGKDRGALRALAWSEKVSAMGKSLLGRFSKEGEAMLAGTKIWVCDICGFIYIGDAPPEICPVCKVPQFKIEEVERR